ncbi:MAG: DUF1326 domain-containing protein [Acidobacteriota bacterium]|nr:DUF1326 domain-containing protein [Acidobacteriota bacterium]
MNNLIKICGVAALLLLAIAISGQIPAPAPANEVYYDGANWNLKGEGIVCCPCATPCPCRTNSQPSYGHCEATLYLRIRQGQYGPVNMAGLQVVDSGGMCAIHYQQVSALYFDNTSASSQRDAFMKLMASMAPKHEATFPYVRVVPFNVQTTGDHYFKVMIPGILQMTVDRNWGLAAPPMPEVAAPDYFSNAIQYAQNIRYSVHDSHASLDFDYSRRQANYRKVDLNVNQYRCQSMLIQHEDGAGWFNAAQLKLIQAQHLAIVQVNAVRQEAMRLREAQAQ